jgi:hypothetical protein
MTGVSVPMSIEESFHYNGTVVFPLVTIPTEDEQYLLCWLFKFLFVNFDQPTRRLNVTDINFILNGFWKYDRPADSEGVHIDDMNQLDYYYYPKLSRLANAIHRAITYHPTTRQAMHINVALLLIDLMSLEPI